MSLPEPLVIESPLGRIVCDPTWRTWLEERGYLSGIPAPSTRRAVFFQSSRRENARRTDGPDGIVVYDKLLRGKRDGNAGLHEWDMLRRAADAGVRVSLPLCAAAVKVDGVHVAALTTAELRGRALADLVKEPPGSLERRRAIARAVGRAIARLHDAGLTFPSLFAKHVVIDDDHAVGFLDLADAQPHTPRLTHRARDLGALGSTLPRWPVSRGLRLVALRAYLDETAAPWRLRDAWRSISDAIDRRMRRRRYRIHLAGSPTSPRTIEAAGPDARFVREEFASLDRYGGIDALTIDGPPRALDGDLVIVRDTRERTVRKWNVLELIHAFDVPAPHAVAMRFDADRGALLRRDDRPTTQEPCLDERLLPVLKRLFRAGLVPNPALAAAMVMDDDDRIHILEPELDQPSIVHARRQIRRFRTLMNAFVRRGMDASCARRLCRELADSR